VSRIGPSARAAIQASLALVVSAFVLAAPVTEARGLDGPAELPLAPEILPEWHWRESTEAFVRAVIDPAAGALVRGFRESRDDEPPPADPALAPDPPAPLSLPQIGSVSVGDELAGGWSITAIRLEAYRVTVRIRRQGATVVLLASTDPSAPSGPFDRGGAKVVYQSSPIPMEAFAGAAQDLVQRWAAAAPEGHIGEALPSWGAAARRASEAAVLDLALERLRRGDTQGVVRDLTSRREDPTAPAVTHLLLGLALRGRDDSVDELVRAASALSDPAVLYGIVRLVTEARQFERAQTVVARLRSLAPSSAAAHVAEGDRHLLGGDWTAAEASYHRAVAADPQFFGARGSLGDALYRLRAYNDAAVELRAALALDPSQGALLHRLGAVELDRDRAADAVPFLERATAAVPAQAEPWKDLGRALLRLGRADDAATALARAIALDPEDPAPRYVLAQALQRLGRLEDAATALADAIARSEADRKRRGKAIQASPQP
jgi:tetratricopeptide (TPR) repeat protein